MIDGLHPHDLRLKRALVLVEVANELELGGRRADDEDRFGAFQRASYLSEESLCVVGVAPLLVRPDRMAVHVMIGRADARRIEPISVYVENLGFVVINPNGNMSCVHSGLTGQCLCLLQWMDDAM